MKIIQPSYEILTPIDSKSILQHIERIARVCYKSEGNITEDGESARKLVKRLIGSGHEAMIEHFSISVKFTVDRGISHELVRHRLASFAQESTRYCNYSKDKFDGEITFIDIWGGMQLDKSMDKINRFDKAFIYDLWKVNCEVAENKYMKMTEYGCSPQIARGVLGNSLKTELTVTANLREWREIFKQRTAPDAHPQARQVMIPLLAEMKEKLFVVFGDIGGGE